MLKRYVNFLIVPEGRSRSIEFKLSFLMVRVLIALVAFLLLFVIVLSFFHGKLLYEVIAGNSLKQKNDELSRYNSKVVELEKELRDYKSFVQRVAQLAGIAYQGETEMQLAYYSEDAFPDTEAMEAIPFLEEGQTFSVQDSVKAESDSLTRVPMGKPIEGWITQRFSMNISGFGGQHPGVDFAAKVGTEVRSTADGEVVLVGWDDIYGNLVAIDHGNGYTTYFGHNSKIMVNIGDAIHRGQVIALSGNTGRSSAPHLHYEIRKDGVPINPEDFLNQR